jgi:hypothetical protein
LERVGEVGEGREGHAKLFPRQQQVTDSRVQGEVAKNGIMESKDVDDIASSYLQSGHTRFSTGALAHIILTEKELPPEILLCNQRVVHNSNISHACVPKLVRRREQRRTFTGRP